MYSVADDYHDAKPRPQQVQPEPTKEPVTAETRHPPAAGHNPRPLVVEDDMATCG
jgi:hypothetical protein